MKITDDNVLQDYVDFVPGNQTVIEKKKKPTASKKAPKRSSTEANMASVLAKGYNRSFNIAAASTPSHISTCSASIASSLVESHFSTSSASTETASEIDFAILDNVTCEVELVSSFKCPFVAMCDKSFTDKEAWQGHIRAHLDINN